MSIVVLIIKAHLVSFECFTGLFQKIFLLGTNIYRYVSPPGARGETPAVTSLWEKDAFLVNPSSDGSGSEHGQVGNKRRQGRGRAKQSKVDSEAWPCVWLLRGLHALPRLIYDSLPLGEQLLDSFNAVVPHLGLVGFLDAVKPEGSFPHDAMGELLWHRNHLGLATQMGESLATLGFSFHSPRAPLFQLTATRYSFPVDPVLQRQIPASRLAGLILVPDLAPEGFGKFLIHRPPYHKPETNQNYPGLNRSSAAIVLKHVN